MLHELPAAVAGFIVATISATGYAGVAALMAVESACIPIPSEIIMPFSGYLVSTGRFNLLLAATAGAVGCNIGSTVAYMVGRHGGRPLVERWGSYVLISRRDLDDADRFFARWGGIAVLVGRLLPVIRTFIALPAGIARLPQLKFQIYTFVGSWPWCFALAYAGYKLGQRWNTDPSLHALMRRFDLLVLAAVALGLVWYVWRHFRRARRG
ncbi:MAG TPA: DedA family protein [Stellaceae bacterium]|jgi:membrane protein DedA with SNARE-associated domain|nr:DedA family protein [Stellaceae bacterium]